MSITRATLPFRASRESFWFENSREKRLFMGHMALLGMKGLKLVKERHSMKHIQKENAIKEGDVLLIKRDERNCGKWNVGIVE